MYSSPQAYGHDSSSRVGIALVSCNIHVHKTTPPTDYPIMVFPRDNETRSSVYSSYTLHTRGLRCLCDHELLGIHRCYTTLPTYTPTGLLHTHTQSLLNQLAKSDNIHMFGHNTNNELFIVLRSLLVVYVASLTRCI